jgi:O-antigen ligase
VSAVQPPVESDRAAPSATVAASAVRRLLSVSPLDLGRAGLVLTLVATPLPSGALMNLGLAVALAGAALHVWSGGVAGRRLPAAVWLMVAFSAATAVSTLVAIDPWCSFAGPGGLLRAAIAREEIPLWCGFRGLLDTTRSTLFFVLVVTLLGFERLRRTWLVAIVAVTCFVTLSGLLEYALGHRTGGLFLRDVAIGHSNQTASYLVMALPVSVSVLLAGVLGGGARFLALFTLGLGAVALVSTQSLTAWAAGLVVALVLGARIASRRALVLVSAMAVSVASIVFVVGPGFEKFTAAWLAMSTGSRLTWWAGALRVIADHPFFGIGPRNFGLIDRTTYDFQTTFHAHNLYLNIASEHGLVGLALLLAAVAAVGWRLRETRAAIASDVDRACWWAAACAVLAFALLGLATTPYHSRHAILLWAIVGVFYAQFADRIERVRAA